MKNPTLAASSLLSLLLNLWSHLSRRRQHQFILLMGLVLVSSFAEVISLGAVLPFIGILTAPEQVLNYPFVAGVAQALDITSAKQLILPLTVIFILAALAAGAIRLLLLWVNTRLSFAAGADLSVAVYQRTLYQPYQVHVARNSSEVISGIANKTSGAISMLYQSMTLISAIVLMVFITFTLMIIDPVVASVAALGFGAIYISISWLLRRQLKRNSQDIALGTNQVIKALQEGLGSIRDVLLDGTQPVYCDIHRRAEQKLRKARGNNHFIAGSPRYAMEALGMALIAALAYSLSQQDKGIASALPVLGALALGAQRILPALQQSYSAWTSIAGSQASLIDVLELLNQPFPKEVLLPPPEPLIFRDTIHFNDVYFRYKVDSPWVLKGINMAIPKGARVGFVGSTGSGKSTMLDLLMGLLESSKGQILVDGQAITGERCRMFQQIIAHVPQNIYLADKTIAENIALSVSPENIDMERVRHAARQAQIADFIESQPETYQAFVGERGVRLSGGQRQRIGIARALYKQATVLIFDEATSALDNSTEQAVMDSIKQLGRDLTILLIAHRLTTVQSCDIIVMLEQGRIEAQGTYEQLLDSSPSFRDMASATA